MAGSIEIRNLRVKRGSFVLDVPALDVHPHEIFAILGSTGSGKTVLMEAVAGACSWERGEILLDGKRADTLPIQQRHLGAVKIDVQRLRPLPPHDRAGEHRVRLEGT